MIDVAIKLSTGEVVGGTMSEHALEDIHTYGLGLHGVSTIHVESRSGSHYFNAQHIISITKLA